MATDKQKKEIENGMVYGNEKSPDDMQHWHQHRNRGQTTVYIASIYY